MSKPNDKIPAEVLSKMIMRASDSELGSRLVAEKMKNDLGMEKKPGDLKLGKK